MSRNMTIMLIKLQCDTSTGETGHDEVYFKIWVDGSYKQTYPEAAYDGICFRMDNEDASLRYCNLDLALTYGQEVKLQLREQDNKNNEDHDEILGTLYIKTAEIPVDGPRIYTNLFNDYKSAEYRLTWRIVSHKVPSLRILGLGCQKSSCNCNKDLADQISSCVGTVLSHTSKVIGFTKIPQAKEISAALDIASRCIGAVTELAEWIANAVEGADDVYIQQANIGQQVNDAVALIPTDGSVIKFDDGDKCMFQTKFGYYVRVPLDIHDVTIEVREKDQLQHDVSLGAFTTGMKDYEENLHGGALMRPLDTYLDKEKGQGAVYHICYSYSYEDYTIAPNWDTASFL